MSRGANAESWLTLRAWPRRQVEETPPPSVEPRPAAQDTRVYVDKEAGRPFQRLPDGTQLYGQFAPDASADGFAQAVPIRAGCIALLFVLQLGVGCLIDDQWCEW